MYVKNVSLPVESCRVWVCRIYSPRNMDLIAKTCSKSFLSEFQCLLAGVYHAREGDRGQTLEHAELAIF